VQKTPPTDTQVPVAVAAAKAPPAAAIVRPFALLLALAAGLQFLLASCQSGETWFILPNLSPPPAAVVGRAMDHADRLSATIPNSYVLLTHGTVKFSIYPPGTALVIQTIAWENLRQGMTAIYYIDQSSSAALAGGIITRKVKDAWMVPGISGWDPSGGKAREPNELVTKERYAGVVAAAFVEENNYNALAMLRDSPTPIAGSCVLRCHVADRR
jgi:hypothetical protein